MILELTKEEVELMLGIIEETISKLKMAETLDFGSDLVDISKKLERCLK